MKLFFLFVKPSKIFLKIKVNVNPNISPVLDKQFCLWYHYSTKKVYVNSFFKIFL